jgi:ATP/maltotriose-dependent transcriptional regulator MalT
LYCLGDLEPATAIARAGVEAARALGQGRLELRFINALAVIAARNTDLVGGYAHDLRAMQLCRELGNRADEAVCLSNLGNTLLGFGDFDQARNHLDEALHLARAVGTHFVEPHVLRHLALCALQCGEPARARELAQQAQTLSIRMKDKGGETSSVLCAAQAELTLGHEAAAEAAFRHAYRLGTELDHPQRLDAIAGLARTALARGAPEEAAAHAETLLAHFAQHGSFAGAESPQRIHLDCFLVLQRLSDPRAAAVLGDAHRELQAQAALISDLRLRECFLTRIEENRGIAQAWQLANPHRPAV